MKELLRFLQQRLAERRARRRARPALSAAAEMHRGSLVGLVVCLFCAFALGGHPGPMLVAAVLGAGFGALTGLLVWVGSEHFKELPVIPPQRSRWRAEHDGPAGWPGRYVGSACRPQRPHRSHQR